MLIETLRWFNQNDLITLNEIKMTGVTNIVTALYDVPIGEVWQLDDILNLNQDGESNDSIKINRTEKNLMKETVYIAQELIIMSEFIKNDIDRNDDLLFKITIFVLNGMILAGQQLWKNYVDDSI